MTFLHVGDTARGVRFHLPAEAVTQTFAILAKRGVGKTYTAAVMVEEMLKAGLHVAIVDPVGVWWGLRSSADGAGPGLPIAILGGEHGDLPIAPDAGQVVADLIVDEQISVVIDLSLLRKGEATHFMTDFAERLYFKNRAPLHLVLDEADAFAPQKPYKGQERLLGAIEDIVRRGRARGLGGSLVTQRAAVVNKDVLTQVEVLVALRTIAPQDREAIDAWIRVHGTPELREELMSSLPSLPVGECWIWSPGWLDVFERVRIRRRETFDSSATPTVGQTAAAPRTLADVDVAALTARLSATIERARADDPRTLRQRIAELERELRNRPTSAPTKIETVIERVEVPVLDERHTERLAELSRGLAESAMRIIDVANDLQLTLKEARLPTPPEAPTEVPAEPAPRRVPVPKKSLDAPSLRAGERRMLETLARHYPLALTRTQLATLAGYAVGGGTFTTYLSTLRRHGLVDEEGGDLRTTVAGQQLAGVAPAPLSTGDVLSIWRSALRAGERKMLDELVAVYPRWISRGELARRTEYEISGGTFGTYLSTLRRNGLAVVEGDQVAASSTLFVAERHRALGMAEGDDAR